MVFQLPAVSRQTVFDQDHNQRSRGSKTRFAMMDVTKLSAKMGTRQVWLREVLAEFLGTFVLVFLGNCSVAQMVLSQKEKGTPTSVHLAYGLAVMSGVLVAGGGSGAHLNPAVTFALAVVGKFRWKKVPHYFLGQYLGAFVSAACTYLVYHDAMDAFDGGSRKVEGPLGTAGIFTTYPAEFLSTMGAFSDQVLGTFVLLLLISAITDRRNMELSKNQYPLYVGLVVVVIGIGLGFNCGYPLNPARDLGPRVFITIAGWGPDAFTLQGYWWVPIVGPHVGALLGVLIYTLMVEIHWPHSVSADHEAGIRQPQVPRLTMPATVTK